MELTNALNNKTEVDVLEFDTDWMIIIYHIKY
jgi:hypothetical protein